MIVYYDGVCALCNRLVRWALRHDKQGRLQFAPLESRRGTRMRDAFPETRNVDSVVVHEGDRVWLRSEALLKIAEQLGGIWRVAALGRLLPRALRDRLYDAVARGRYERFGKLAECPIPPPELRSRFLLD